MVHRFPLRRNHARKKVTQYMSFKNHTMMTQIWPLLRLVLFLPTISNSFMNVRSHRTHKIINGRPHRCIDRYICIYIYCTWEVAPYKSNTHTHKIYTCMWVQIYMDSGTYLYGFGYIFTWIKVQIYMECRFTLIWVQMYLDLGADLYGFGYRLT